MDILNTYSEGQKNFGLLMLRIGIGAMFILHGYPKLIGGPEMWENLGNSMQQVGIHFLPTLWGFLSAIAEFGGGILMITGILFRPAMLLMFINMVIAALHHFNGAYNYKNLMEASHAIEAGILFFCLLFIGPGNYKLGKITIE